MTDTVRVPKAFSDWLYGVEGYGLRVERLSEELRDPVDKLLPWLLAAFEVGLAVSPQGEGSSADAPMEAVAWRVRRRKEDAGFGRPQVFTTDDASEADLKQWRSNGYEVQPLYTHPAPIKTSADTGELRERVADAAYVVLRHGDYKPGTDNGLIPHGERLVPLAIADAILDLIRKD